MLMKKSILYILAFAICLTSLYSCSIVTDENKNSVKNEDGEIVHKSTGSLFDDLFASKDAMLGGRSEMSDAEMEAPSAAESFDGEMKYDGDFYQNNIKAGTLTAGEWRDNDNFSEFLELLNQNEWYGYMKIWNMFPSRRVVVKTVKDETAVKNVKLVLYDEKGEELCKGTTNHNGEAYLFYDLDSEKSNAKPSKISYSVDNIKGEHEISSAEEIITIDINDASSENVKKKLDLMFMIDTTGSMGDELSYLQEELKDVILRVSSNQNNNMDIRLSVNFYRDHQDEYTVRYYKFNNDIDEAVKKLSEQYAYGGGDYPEAVDEAFENGIDTHQWEEDSVKLMFFVLDAPPHSDREGSVERMHNTLKNASEKGVRVMPIASSGVDKETEYLMRTLAVTTGGTYIFLTNDSGIGGDHIDPSIGEHDVEKLNDLLVRIINEYCA